MSNYIYLYENECEGWTVPIYPSSAEQFEKEVITYCKLVKEEITVADFIEDEFYKGAARYERIYKYLDGTLFGVIKYIKDDETFIEEIKGQCTNDDSFETIYHNNVENW
jgi:hypothetical protein